MKNEIDELPEFDLDDIKLRIQRVSDYLLDKQLHDEFGWQPPSEHRQYLKDVEALVRWVNTPESDF